MTDRKLLSITTRKLAYYKQRLEDLRECEKAMTIAVGKQGEKHRKIGCN